MNLEKLLFEPARLVPGEIRYCDGEKSMYLFFDNRGRHTWATEGRHVQFTTHTTQGYLDGRCVKVDGHMKTVSIQMVRGVFDLGSIHTLPIEEIGRFEDVVDEDEVAEMAHTLSVVLGNGVGVGGPTIESLQELRSAQFAAEHADREARMGALLGDDVYEWLKRVEPAFRDLTSAVANDRRERKQCPSPKIARLHIKMRKVLASAPSDLLKRGAAQ